MANGMNLTTGEIHGDNKPGAPVHSPRPRRVDEPEERRSPISVYSSVDDGSSETHYNNPAEQMFDQIGQVIQRGQAARQQKRQLDDAALASALVYSKQNNGFMPPDMTEAISQQLGFPIVGGNFAGNGDYIIYGRKQIQSQNGKVRGEQIVPIAIANPEMQFKVLQRSGLGQSMQEELYDAMRAKMKLTDQQFADRGILDPRAKQKAAEAQMALKEKELMLKYGRKPLSFGEFIKAVTSSDQLMNSITGMDASGNIAQEASDDPGASNVKADPATLVAQRLRKAYDEWSRPDAANDPWAAMAQSQGQTQQPQNPQSPQNPQPQAQQPGDGAQGQEDELLPNGQMRHNGKLYEKAGEKNGVVQWRPVGNAPEAQKGKEQPATQTSASRQPTYDTELTPDEESQYQAWRAKLPKPLQYDGDYDLRGYWKDPETQKEGIEDGQHFTDKYKKPNHPTFSNESKYAIGDNARIAGRWDGDKFVPSEAQLSNAEKRRVSEFQKLGGEYKQDDDGSVHARISNWEYLPNDLKERYSSELDDLDDIAVDIQRKANEAKRRFDDDFKSSVLPEIKDEAKKAHPNNAELRLRYIERKTNEWRALHDPAEMRNESVRKELNMTTRLR